MLGEGNVGRGADGDTSVPLAARLPAAIAALGLGLGAVHLGTTVVGVGPRGVLERSRLVGHVVMLVVVAGLVLGAGAIDRSSIETARYRRIAGWVSGALAGNLAMNLLFIASFGFDELAPNLQWATWAAAFGALIGLAIGGMEARAIDRAVATERQRVRASAVEAQRDWLDYINSLLRHEVLNNANVITGYADLVDERVDDPTLASHVRTIRRQADDMTDVVTDVRVLIEATQDGPTIEPIDLESVLREELADLRETFPDVETDLTLPEEDVAVAADDIVSRVFANLLSNAVEHNDAETPRVDVDVEADQATVTVDIADNGPGIPESMRESLFDRGPGDHGLGLYLVGVLVDRYDGAVELAETGDDGSVFTVELTRIDPDADAVEPSKEDGDGTGDGEDPFPPERPSTDEGASGDPG